MDLVLRRSRVAPPRGRGERGPLLPASSLDPKCGSGSRSLSEVQRKPGFAPLWPRIAPDISPMRVVAKRGNRILGVLRGWLGGRSYVSPQYPKVSTRTALSANTRAIENAAFW